MVDASVVKFWEVRHELSHMGSAIYRQEKRIPPLGIRKRIVDIAQVGHLGRSVTRAKVRSEYWWPGMDSFVEEVVRECFECGNSDKTLRTRVPPLSPVQVPNKPWKNWQ